MWPPPPRRLIGEGECIGRLVPTCTHCKFMDWTGEIEPDETLQICKERYWSDLMIKYKAPINFDDCSVMEQFCDEMVGDYIS